MGDPLYILAFDHRGSFKKKFGVSGDPTPDEQAQLEAAKGLVWEGVKLAVSKGAPSASVGALVDEEMGAAVAREAKQMGIPLAMPVEKSGQPLFDFEYGDDFGAHISEFDPTYSKVLVRWNPEDDPQDNEVQGARLRRLSDWLRANDRQFLFELLVPATDHQMELVGGNAEAYDSEARPYLTLGAIDQIMAAGIEPHIWKIEGLDRRVDCELLAGLIRRDGRDDVTAVVLGRGADDAKVDHWLEMGAPVAGYNGFAIGRSIWSQGVEGWAADEMSREDAAANIADNYMRFIDVYAKAAG